MLAYALEMTRTRKHVASMRTLLSVLIVGTLCISAPFAHAQSIVPPATGTTASAALDRQALINQLLAQVTILQQKIAALKAAQTVLPTSSTQFCNITRTLIVGARGGDVSCLQAFLIAQNLLASDSATGYFGRLTEQAVKQWQAQNNIVSSGSSAATGFGAVGPRTRAALVAFLASRTASSAPASITNNTSVTNSAPADTFVVAPVQTGGGGGGAVLGDGGDVVNAPLPPVGDVRVLPEDPILPPTLTSATGTIERITPDGRVTGWFVKPGSSSTAVPVYVVAHLAGTRVYDKVLGTATPEDRADVNQRFGVSGTHGFNFALPASVRDGNTWTICASLINSVDACQTPSSLIGSQSYVSISVKKSYDIDQVWSYGPSFEAIQVGKHIYIGYYDKDRKLTVAQFDTTSGAKTIKRLNDVFGGWDSHNVIRLGMDPWNNLHVSGDMHGVPLVYGRTTGGDFNTLKLTNVMTGTHESQVTYPAFINLPNNFIFEYRDGYSGNGKTYLKTFDGNIWSYLFPLVSGNPQELFSAGTPTQAANAYPTGFILGPDGWYHIAWTWRTAGDAANNFNLNYAKSKDLTRWYNALGMPLTLPITPDSPTVVDIVPRHGGMFNSYQVSFDPDARVVITYTKYDGDPAVPVPDCTKDPSHVECGKSVPQPGIPGASQIYNARLENGSWRFYQMTHWHARAPFAGGGSLPAMIGFWGLVPAPDGHWRQALSTYLKDPRDTGAVFEIDPITMVLGGAVLNDRKTPASLGKVLATTPYFAARVLPVKLQSGEYSTRYFIRWESEANYCHDRIPSAANCPGMNPVPSASPPPSQLQIYDIESYSATPLIPAAKPSCTLVAASSTVSRGKSTKLYWTSGNATEGTIDNGIGAISAVDQGSVNVTPAANATYTLRVNGASGSASCSTIVAVVAPPTPPSCTLSISPTTTINGAPATFAWTSSSATTLSIDHGIGSVTPVAAGSKTINTASTTTAYRMTATNIDGSATCDATLQITLAPPPGNLLTQCAPDGTSAVLSWDPVQGATNYPLLLDYVDNNSSSCIDGWLCANSSDQHSPSVSTKYTATGVVPGGQYHWWIHSTVNGVYSKAVMHARFTCPIR